MSIVLPGQLILESLPGFVDLADAQLGNYVVLTDDAMVKLNQNAQFAQIREEFIFMGYFKNGDTVPVAVSPVDGYQYGRDEMLVDYAFYTTRGTTAQFSSGQAIPPDFGVEYTDLSTASAGATTIHTSKSTFPQTLGGLPIAGQQIFITPGNANLVAGNYTILHWLDANDLQLTVSPSPSHSATNGTGFLYSPGGLSVSQPANLYWHAVDVNDETGKVSIIVSYYQPNGTETQSSDGVIRVIANCQRQSLNTSS